MRHKRPNVMARNYNNRMLVMYRPNLCENLSYPFVRFGNGTRNISAPILNILATILMAAGSPVVIAGTKEIDASWLDIAVDGLPKFDHYRCACLALGMGPLPAPSAGFVHQTIKGVSDLGQNSNGICSIKVATNARQVDREVLYKEVG
jgi:hypothetical protein